MAIAPQRKHAKMTLQYEPEADVLSVEYARRTPIDHAMEVGNLIVHVSRSGSPVLVEILNASQFTEHAHALTHRRLSRRAHTQVRP
ncbi:DUF2283 domain-containing protein [Candidatus Uhrbacteria bacterium]|nr:DUF2283 domain-containing protein [Candidatus Uhrbacteria bacterium]